MRDLIVTENITLDGVIDASAGWFSVANDSGVDQSDVVAALREQSEAADAVVFGRVTFEDMRGYWPKQTDDTTGVTDYLNTVSNIAAWHVCSMSLGSVSYDWPPQAPRSGLVTQLRHSTSPHPQSRATAPSSRKKASSQLLGILTTVVPAALLPPIEAVRSSIASTRQARRSLPGLFTTGPPKTLSSLAS